MEASKFRYTAQQVREEEVRVLLCSSQLLPRLLGPSDVYDLLLLVTGLERPPAEMREFLEKICLYEMWEGGSARPLPFVLALTALVVYLEVAGDFVLMKKLLRVVHFEWDEDVHALYPQVGLCRRKLLGSVKKLSKDWAACQKIVGLESYDFSYLVARVLKPTEDVKKGKGRKE